MGAKKIEEPKKPSIYQFHDYRDFLNHWVKFLNQSQKTTARSLSLQAGLSPLYLTKILLKNRNMSPNALEKLAPHLKLNQGDLSFFRHLIEFNDAKGIEQKNSAYQKIRKFAFYRFKNEKTLVAHAYWTNWFYPAIREMAGLEGFQPDPKWIQKQLNQKVSLPELQEALHFLLENKFLEIDQRGQVRSPDTPIECAGPVFSMAITNYQEQVAQLAVDAIQAVPRPERQHATHTLSIYEEELEEVRSILKEALTKVQKISKRKREKKCDRIMQIYIAGFPLTTKEAA